MKDWESFVYFKPRSQIVLVVRYNLHPRRQCSKLRSPNFVSLVGCTLERNVGSRSANGWLSLQILERQAWFAARRDATMCIITICEFEVTCCWAVHHYFISFGDLQSTNVFPGGISQTGWPCRFSTSDLEQASPEFCGGQPFWFYNVTVTSSLWWHCDIISCVFQQTHGSFKSLMFGQWLDQLAVQARSYYMYPFSMVVQLFECCLK